MKPHTRPTPVRRLTTNSTRRRPQKPSAGVNLKGRWDQEVGLIEEPVRGWWSNHWVPYDDVLETEEAQMRQREADRRVTGPGHESLK